MSIFSLISLTQLDHCSSSDFLFRCLTIKLRACIPQYTILLNYAKKN